VSLLQHYLYLLSNSYEDWGVDELIVEDSWKRQSWWRLNLLSC
jgi:hypothetical protein